MMPPLRPDWIFLDFDGVIMDSMELKLDAYCCALQEYGFPREKIREQQRRYAGISRSKTIPLMAENLSGRAMSEAERDRTLRLFTEADERLREKMQLKEGAYGFLEAMQGRIPLVVVTGTPQEVIDRTIAHFELGPFFEEVRGYPPAKAEHLLEQLQRRKLDAERALYVGDAIMDYEAATEAGMPFVGINNGDDPFEGKSLAAEFRDLGELTGWLALQ